MFNKFKLLLEDDSLFYGLCVILVGCACFGLGRLSIDQIEPQNRVSAGSVVLTELPPASVAASEAASSAARYVGSKSGSKYHLLTCPGASQIKEVNKIYFNTKEEALQQGYAPAANCPGL
jgi:hypothetical protein